MDRRQSRPQFPASVTQAAGPALFHAARDEDNEPFQFSLEYLVEAAANCRSSCSEDLESFRVLARSLSQQLAEEREGIEKDLRPVIDDKILKLLSTTLEVGDSLFTRLAIIDGALEVEDIQRDLTCNSRDVGLAWTCLIWYWAAWNQDCRRIITELSPVLGKNWTPPCDKAWKWGLQVVGAVCERRLTERRNAQPEDWEDWEIGLASNFPEASEWYDDARREWRRALEAPSEQGSPEPAG